MAYWDALADDLSRTFVSIETDLRFRTTLLRQQCERLQSICNYIQELDTAHCEEKALRQTEMVAVEQSIQDAIQRARQIRTEHAANGDSSNEKRKAESHSREQLQNILAIAKATQSVQRIRQLPETRPRARLIYPRELKALEKQLHDLQEKERESSMRFAFCCKMNEYLSLSPARRQFVVNQKHKLGRHEIPVARIQTSFPCQMASLQHAYQKLHEFVLTKVKLESLQFEQIAKAPTLSSVIPIYCRVKQAKRILRLLDSETKALSMRLPDSAPQLSESTIHHRDTILAKIRKKTSRVNAGGIDNQALVDAASHRWIDKQLLEKLQGVWNTDKSAQVKALHPHDLYPTAVSEIVLTKLLNSLLESIRTCSTDTTEPRNASQVEGLMRLVRLVDSIALSGGRTYRSIVASH
ncbi:uncharacterized protein PHALS_07507 [Plasmopara halstedii]|uniref:Uncharacterized protein n=1 Tax=Plasmopara halstedii TaxID=4781 RepID=A0A0P1B4Q0_PLAHL|nr:uncharacterized protein PHALS_07507 [Plasmopara halstedii]CEG49761.1 hypothetical protein PHALS_07507 [Plasmopara halstedii]|eukprot:XP_024586130.1 hypothetical protein PHALS_07507 [Plasmopara halstedii]